MLLPLVLAICVHTTLSWDIRVTPESAIIRPGDVINVTCHADIPLAACQIESAHATDPANDLSTDNPPPPFSRGNYFSYSPIEFGPESLKRGRCSIQYTAGSEENTQIFGCRGRTATGPWKYDYFSVSTHNGEVMPMSITPRHPLYVLLGDELTIICKTAGPIQRCGISVRYEWQFFTRGQTSSNRNYYEFAGAGLDAGECGIKIHKVTEADSAWFQCKATAESGALAHLINVIRVARPPSREPSLNVPRDTVAIGDVLSATCDVPESRPPANVTWYLGSRVVGGVEVPANKFLWPVTSQGRFQKLSRKVTADDDGKLLRCVVTHAGMTQPMEATRKISVGSGTVTSATVVTCSALVDPSVDIACSNAGTVVPCDRPIPTGTVAYMKCKEAYVLNPYPGYRSITCTSRGRWSRPAFKCTPDCGKPNPIGGVGFVSNGVVAKVGEFPWHVGLYKKSRTKTEQICAGSLVTPSIVITAAHCVWDDSRNVVEDKSRYLVAAGKFQRAWDADEEGAQRRGVRHLHVHERYLGATRSLATDIAVIVVDEVITLTRYVNVVCMDWSGNLDDVHLVDGNNGTVPGWGITENNTASDVLMSVNLPFISFSRCKNLVAASFLPFITADKICAGWRNLSTAVCPGDSGGGLVFPLTTAAGARYYLQGIVSAGHRPQQTGLRCDIQQVTTFTKVAFYREWLEGHVFGEEEVKRK